MIEVSQAALVVEPGLVVGELVVGQDAGDGFPYLDVILYLLGISSDDAAAAGPAGA